MDDNSQHSFFSLNSNLIWQENRRSDFNYVKHKMLAGIAGKYLPLIPIATIGIERREKNETKNCKVRTILMSFCS